MRHIVLLVAALALAPAAGATEIPRPSDRAAPGEGSHGDAPIKVTINPEGRVSAAFLGPLPMPAPRGTPIEFGIEVVNQGFVTGRLEARLVGNPPASAILDLDPELLKGIPHETRTLRITLTNVGQTDLTIAFRLRNEVPDLGGRDRIHLLMRGQ
jgi:hypothetical protein